MKGILPLVLLVALCTLPSCAGYVRADKFRPTWQAVTERLREYVEADESLADVERRAVLRELEIGDEVLREAVTR